MIKGIFAPIPTPFVDEEVAYEKLGENVAKWGKTGLSGLVVFGSNGEAPYLSADEKVEVWAYVRKHLPEEKIMIAGTGQESTRATISLTKRAASVGAQAALVVNPNFYKGSMKEPALDQFYRDVADASPIPILIYNMPGNTGINMSSSLVAGLSNHPNIAGVKDSGGNIVQISEILRDAPDDFAVFAGSASFLFPAAVMGAVGGTLATANVVPDLCVKLLEHAQKGEIEEGRKLQKNLLALNAAVTSRFGVAGLKAALDMIGYYGGLPRRPMLPLTDEAKAELKGILMALGVEVAG